MLRVFKFDLDMLTILDSMVGSSDSCWNCSGKQTESRTNIHTKPLFSSRSKASSQLQKYYSSLESRIGYYLVLGGTRHLGYYAPGTKWPFPINAALRRMEDHLFDALALPPGAKVLDAGCGVGHVAMHMARRGLRVQGVDIVENHVRWAQQNIETFGFEGDIDARLMDFHDLSAFDDSSFDAVYTSETLVHAHDPQQVLREFFRVLRPGGSLALWEYEHLDLEQASRVLSPDPEAIRLIGDIHQVNKSSSMPGNHSFSNGVLRSMLKEEGFQDVKVEDLSENVKPMVRLFYLLAYIPWLIICFLGLQAHFVNTQAGTLAYPAMKRRLQTFVGVTAKKPMARVSSNGGPHKRSTG